MEIHEVAIAQLEAEADQWAESVDLINMIKMVSRISRVAHNIPLGVREGMIGRQESLMDDLMRQAFIEGAYRAAEVITAHTKKPDQ